jgi:hypothetical protein
MRYTYVTAVGTLAVAGALLSLAVGSVAGQTAAPKAAAPKPATAAPKPSAVPKTPWGAPDLQGTWFVMEQVPFTRSVQNANKPFLTDEEVAAADKAKSIDPGRNARRGAATAADVEGAYNAVFNSVLRTSKRTSMIIDPENGQIPPLTPEAEARQGRGGRGGAAAPAGGRGAALAAPAPPAAAAGGGRGGGGRGGQNDNPETTAQNPRCLGVQMPFLPINTAFAQGTVMQIVQGQKSMAIYMEDDHAGGSVRVIHLDGRPFSSVKSTLGESRGRWIANGNTLEVETRNFTQGFRGSQPESYRMIERYTRVDANNLRREITFDDPKTWTKPWTILIEMGKTSDSRHMIFDSTCHEGNYGMTGILIGARREEAAAAGR